MIIGEEEAEGPSEEDEKCQQQQQSNQSFNLSTASADICLASADHIGKVAWAFFQLTNQLGRRSECKPIRGREGKDVIKRVGREKPLIRQTKGGGREESAADQLTKRRDRHVVMLQKQANDERKSI
ncbi:hypothetical protein niasHT_001253 [Heterodera trifolii]|uniref:Uncharacterized protein n=1 Tax=Heterodera trifolii TaxID=157864 RepID=A0ABD2M697_9BILA